MTKTKEELLKRYLDKQNKRNKRCKYTMNELDKEYKYYVYLIKANEYYYVGCTSDVVKRMYIHKNKKSVYVDGVEYFLPMYKHINKDKNWSYDIIYRTNDKEEVYDVESNSIKKYKKLYGDKVLNKQGNKLTNNKEYYKNNKDEINKRRREYYENNKDEINKRRRERNKIFKEKNIEHNKQYYSDNKEYFTEYQKEYISREDIREKRREYYKKYRDENREKIREINRRSYYKLSKNDVTN